MTSTRCELTARCSIKTKRFSILGIVMVKKGSRRGLNTGNTIRDYRHNPALRQYQKYGCLVLGERVSIDKNPKAKATMRDVHTQLSFADPGLEFSMNKQRRWELPAFLIQKVYAEAGRGNVEVS